MEETTNKESRRPFHALFPTLWFTVASALMVYFIVTFPDRSECSVCPDFTESRGPPLVWYTTWTLWLTTLVQWKKFDFLFPFVLPLSLTVTILYTVYFLTNDLGRALVDEDLCYHVSDSAIPKEGTSDAMKSFFFAADRLVNATAHYICALYNLYLYCIHRDVSNSTVGLSFVAAWMILHGVMILVIHLWVSEVYCTDDVAGGIYGIVAINAALVVGLHLIFFRCRLCSKKRDSEQQVVESIEIVESSVNENENFDAKMD